MGVGWIVAGRLVAEPQATKVSAEPTLDGVKLSFEAGFQLVEWPHWPSRGPVSLALLPREVVAVMRGAAIPAGFLVPERDTILVPMSHSCTATVTYVLHLSTRALTALEERRNGDAVQFKTVLAAHVHVGSPVDELLDVFRQSVVEGESSPDENALLTILAGRQVRTVMSEHRIDVPASHWHQLLRDARYCDTLSTEVPLPVEAPEQLKAALTCLKQAVVARDSGNRREVLLRSRMAIEALGHNGFGGRAPKDVVDFLKKNGKRLSMEERYSALMVAADLYANAGAHAQEHDDNLTRTDAEMMLAVTAALIKLAPLRRSTVGQDEAQGDVTVSEMRSEGR